MVNITTILPHEERHFLLDTRHNTLTDALGNDIPMPDGLLEMARTRMNNLMKLVKVRVQLGTECNFSCRYCIQHSNTEKSVYRKIPLNRLSMLVSGIVHYARLAGVDKGENLHVDFIGGEPLLHWEEMTEIIRGIRSFFPESRFFMITNGSLFTADKAKFCLEHNLSPVLSHDGPGQGLRSSDPLAPRSESLAAFQLLAREGDIPLCVNPVLTRHNHNLGEIYEYLCNRLHAELVVSEAMPVEICDDATESLGFRTLEEYGPLIADVCACLERYHPAIFNSYWELIADFVLHIGDRRPTLPVGRCTAYSDLPYVVDTYGNLLRCNDEPPDYVFARSRDGGKTLNRPLTLGDITGRGMSRDDIMAAFRQDRHLPDWRHEERCGGCIVVNSCRGGCPKRTGKYFEYMCNNYKAVGVIALSALFRIMTPDALAVRVEL